MAVPPYEYNREVEDFSQNINTDSNSVSHPFSHTDSHMMSYSLTDSYSLSRSLNSNEGNSYGSVWIERGRERVEEEKGGVEDSVSFPKSNI